MSDNTLRVLCISSSLLFEKEKWEGLQTTDSDYYYNLLLTKSEFRFAHELEADPNYKQIILVAIFKYKNTYFLHKQHSGEVRLNETCSLVIGGHVDDWMQIDETQGSSSSDIIQRTLLREVEEEVQVNSAIHNKKLIGFLYVDDDHSVNQVHVGIVYIWEMSGEGVTTHEEGLEAVGWYTKEQLENSNFSLDYWTQALLKVL